MSLIKTEISAEQYRGCPMWVVTLSDGTTVYQSDDDPSLEMTNSWLGLKKHVEDNDLYIKDMILRFRDHAEVIGSGAEGYYFAHMILANIVGYNQNFFNAGILKNGIIFGHQWIIPEIIFMESFTKSPSDPFTQESLIYGVSPYGVKAPKWLQAQMKNIDSNQTMPWTHTLQPLNT